MKNKHYYKDGTTSESYDNSKITHRTDGPAVEYADGSKAWYIDGKRHRLDGPAVEYADGDKHWYMDGKKHRIDGPASEYADGGKLWYIDGKCHRIDGPAVEYANGNKSWCIDGKYHSEQEHRQIVKEARALSKPLRLIDPRAWVRDL